MENLIFLKDFYKMGHYKQYPEGTTLVFSNFTPRKSLMPGVNHSVFFGLEKFINSYLRNKDIFNRRINAETIYYLMQQYKEIVCQCLGIKDNCLHIKNLLKEEKWPIEIWALPELSVVPCGVPALVIFNTKPEFYWVPNMLETILSCSLWGPSTSATIARQYRLLLGKYCEQTSDNKNFVDYQAHDFSMRGMWGLEAAEMSGLAHLQYFKGTDNIPAVIIDAMERKNAFRGSSIPATEHSIMSAGGKENEFYTFKRLITEVYPDGPVSIVSDTWDLWNVVKNFLPKLKEIIMNRNGKVMIRPDSGDPVEIICGIKPWRIKSYKKSVLKEDPITVEEKGLIECLWGIFGGTINSKGYKELDPHIGAIYGDSITLDRCEEICERLKQKGFSSTNIVFGIGSYTYQYVTRDTLGWAMKATYAEINGKGVNLTKDPKTDDGTKKSHSGILKVIRNDQGEFEVKQNCTWDEFYADDNELKKVY